MANPTLLSMPIAKNGDKNSIPSTLATDTGVMSQEYGFPQSTSTPLEAGGHAPDRKDFNGVFNLLSGIAFYAQKGYHFLYDATQDYFVGCVVIDPTDGKMYICHTDMAVADTVAPHLDTNEDYWRLYNPINECYRQPSTAYATGAIAYHASLPTGYYLECTTAGTTDSGALSLGGGQ